MTNKKDVNGMYVLKTCRGNRKRTTDLIEILKPIAKAEDEAMEKAYEAYYQDYPEAKELKSKIISFAYLPRNNETKKDMLYALSKGWTELQTHALTTIYVLGYYGREWRAEEIIDRLNAGDKTALFDDLEASWETARDWSGTVPYGKLYWLFEKNTEHCIETLQTGIDMLDEYYDSLSEIYDI